MACSAAVEPPAEQNSTTSYDHPIHPLADLNSAFTLLDQLDRLRDGEVSLAADIEGVLGLCAGEVQALRVVAAGHHDAADVAQALGQTQSSLNATLAGLGRRSLVWRKPHRPTTANIR